MKNSYLVNYLPKAGRPHPGGWTWDVICDSSRHLKTLGSMPPLTVRIWDSLCDIWENVKHLFPGFVPILVANTGGMRFLSTEDGPGRQAGYMISPTERWLYQPSDADILTEFSTGGSPPFRMNRDHSGTGFLEFLVPLVSGGRSWMHSDHLPLDYPLITCHHLGNGHKPANKLEKLKSQEEEIQKFETKRPTSAKTKRESTMDLKTILLFSMMGNNDSSNGMGMSGLLPLLLLGGDEAGPGLLSGSGGDLDESTIMMFLAMSGQFGDIKMTPQMLLSSSLLKGKSPQMKKLLAIMLGLAKVPSGDKAYFMITSDEVTLSQLMMIDAMKEEKKTEDK